MPTSAPKPVPGSTSDAGDPQPVADGIPALAPSAALVIDAGGKIVAANGTASDVLAASGKTLIGLPLAGLCTAEGASSAPTTSSDEWKSFCAATLDRWTAFAAHVPGSPARAVYLRLERAFGGAGTYIAVLHPRGRRHG